jgi:hypothetical protein
MRAAQAPGPGLAAPHKVKLVHPPPPTDLADPTSGTAKAQPPLAGGAAGLRVAARLAALRRLTAGLHLPHRLRVPACLHLAPQLQLAAYRNIDRVRAASLQRQALNHLHRARQHGSSRHGGSRGHGPCDSLLLPSRLNHAVDPRRHHDGVLGRAARARCCCTAVPS